MLTVKPVGALEVLVSEEMVVELVPKLVVSLGYLGGVLHRIYLVMSVVGGNGVSRE